MADRSEWSAQVEKSLRSLQGLREDVRTAARADASTGSLVPAHVGRLVALLDVACVVLCDAMETVECLEGCAAASEASRVGLSDR